MGGITSLRNFKKGLFEVVSLDSKYRVYVFSFIIIFLALIPLGVLESGPNLSLCSRIFGSKCYSVGITRGVSSLLKGNLEVALNYNWLSILVVCVMFWIILMDLRKKILKI
jgi:hypothetical protein